MGVNMTNLELIKNSVSCTISLYGDANKDNFGRVVELITPFDGIKMSDTKMKKFIMSLHFNINNSGTSDIFNSDIKEISVEVWIRKNSIDKDKRCSLLLHETKLSLSDYNECHGLIKYIDKKSIVNMKDGIDFEQLGKENILGYYVIFCKLRDSADSKSEKYVVKGMTNLTLF